MADTQGSECESHVLIFDVSYLIFYRIYATRAWYKHSQKEWDEGALAHDPDFDAVLRRKVRECIEACVQRSAHRPIPIFCIDGKRSTHFRRQIYDAYKSNRGISDGYRQMFAAALDEVRRVHSGGQYGPRALWLEHELLEADDIAHYFASRMCSGEPAGDSGKRPSVTIVTSDHDYLPLLQFDNVRIENAKGKPLTLPAHIATASNALQTKIILGDTSDCIPPIAPRLGKKTAAALLDNGGELLAKRLASNSEMRENYERNRRLVDNACLPAEQLAWLGEQYEEAFQ